MRRDRARPSPAHPYRQIQPATVQGTDLALLVKQPQHCAARRIDVETNDVPETFGELGIIGNLRGAHSVEAQAVGLPDATHRGDADADDPGLGCRRSVGSPMSRRGIGQDTARSVVTTNLLHSGVNARSP